jgi:hypothetical protein
MICKDAGLAADAALAPVFAKAKARAADWQFIGDSSQSALDWFNKNARDDLAWRNGSCEGRRDCVEAWFVKRKAMMMFFANSDEGFGDSGVDTVRQLDNMDTLISVRMATHKRNVLFDASEQDFGKIVARRAHAAIRSPVPLEDQGIVTERRVVEGRDAARAHGVGLLRDVEPNGRGLHALEAVSP